MTKVQKRITPEIEIPKAEQVLNQAQRANLATAPRKKASQSKLLTKSQLLAANKRNDG
jgi:hypothetical protein